MASIYDIPELKAWRSSPQLVRIPPELDVPLTPRVRRIIDTQPFRRLSRISQLGLVSLVYPAANHSRQEHSLGVYRVAIEYLNRMAADPRFAAVIAPQDAERFILAALLHDLGHWPFCHPVEDLQLAGVPTHEEFSSEFLQDGELSSCLRDDWQTDAASVVELLARDSTDPPTAVLRSMLSGPIDVDKVDYLMRDSLHAGVPYGRNFDQRRLISSLCLNEAGNGLAITEKGKTAAEMMVFARYVMFSEVYWHHAVRAATAMFQRAFYLLRHALDCNSLFRMTESAMTTVLCQAAQDHAAAELLSGIFGPTRHLYKRVAEYSFIERPHLYSRLARRPFPWLAECAQQLAAVVEKQLQRPVAAHELLIDAPPIKLEVEFDLDVYYPKQGVYRRLGAVSPVVRTLAQQQFDNYVKRVRVFAHPRLQHALSVRSEVGELIEAAIDRTESLPTSCDEHCESAGG